MRTVLRLIAALNGAFQLAVGFLCVASPVGAAHAFQLADNGPSVQALARMFGGLLLGSGLMSALVARDPDRNPELPVLLAIACIANVAADGGVIACGQMTFAQLAVGILLQVLVVSAAVVHVARRNPQRLAAGGPSLSHH